LGILPARFVWQSIIGKILGLYNGAFDWDGRETKTEKMIERTRAPLVAVTVRA